MLMEQMHIFPFCPQEMQWRPDFWEQVKLFQLLALPSWAPGMDS